MNKGWPSLGEIYWGFSLESTGCGLLIVTSSQQVPCCSAPIPINRSRWHAKQILASQNQQLSTFCLCNVFWEGITRLQSIRQEMYGESFEVANQSVQVELKLAFERIGDLCFIHSHWLNILLAWLIPLILPCLSAACLDCRASYWPVILRINACEINKTLCSVKS